MGKVPIEDLKPSLASLVHPMRVYSTYAVAVLQKKEPVKRLAEVNAGSFTHEATESIESSRYSDVRVYLNQNVLGCVNVHLEQPCSVERAIQQHHQTLVGNVRPCRC